MSEFNWWLLIVGLVVGAGLVWLILADSQRRESEVSQAELPAEAAWIASALDDGGQPIDAETAERVLRLHRAYLASLPANEVEAEPRVADDDEDQVVDGASSGTTPVWTATEPSPRRR